LAEGCAAGKTGTVLTQGVWLRLSTELGEAFGSVWLRAVLQVLDFNLLSGKVSGVESCGRQTAASLAVLQLKLLSVFIVLVKTSSRSY
jgi:hypothetical protein